MSKIKTALLVTRAVKDVGLALGAAVMLRYMSEPARFQFAAQLSRKTITDLMGEDPMTLIRKAAQEMHAGGDTFIFNNPANESNATAGQSTTRVFRSPGEGVDPT